MSDNQQRAVLTLAEVEQHVDVRKRQRILTAALDAAEARGRQSVGLGDFVVTTCDEEAPAPAWYFVEQYGDWLPCSRSEGHDGEHEHSDSGYTWADR